MQIIQLDYDIITGSKYSLKNVQLLSFDAPHKISTQKLKYTSNVHGKNVKHTRTVYVSDRAKNRERAATAALLMSAKQK